MKRAREILLLIVIAVVGCLVLGEVTLRILLRNRTFFDIEMSRYARILDIDAADPAVGHVNRPGGHARLMGVDVRINSDGFRDDEYPLEKGDRWRIVILGDSLTFGWGVEREQSFEHLLEEALDARRPTEIINFAACNYNTVQEVNLFLDKGLRYDPDQVVLFWFINDAEPRSEPSPFEWLADLRVVTFYSSRIKALRARFDDSVGFEAYYSRLYEEGAEGWRDSREALIALRDACRERGIALQVVLLPELHELREYTFAEEHARIAGFLEEQGVPVLDLAPRFAGVEDPTSLWVAKDDAHPNAEAHRRIFDYSLEFVASGRDEVSRN